MTKKMTKDAKDEFLDALKDYIGTQLKKAIIKKVVEQITGWLFRKLAFLAWGPLGSIVTYFVTKGVIWLLDQTIIGAHVLYIYGDTTFDRKRVEKLIQKFNKFDENTTDEERKKLDEELDKALIELMQFGTIRLPNNKGS